MGLESLIEPSAVLAELKVGSKKQALQELSQKAAEITGLAERDILETVLQRERLGSTGVGNGIAIPHGKLPGLERIVGLFARLARPIEFDSLDEQPVDLVFLLLAPEASGADHLKALSKVARLLRESDTVERIRASHDAGAIYALMTRNSSQHAA